VLLTFHAAFAPFLIAGTDLALRFFTDYLLPPSCFPRSGLPLSQLVTLFSKPPRRNDPLPQGVPPFSSPPALWIVPVSPLPP